MFSLHHRNDPRTRGRFHKAYALWIEIESKIIRTRVDRQESIVQGFDPTDFYLRHKVSRQERLNVQTCQLSYFSSNITGSHQCFADKDCIHVCTCQSANILGVENAAFRNNRNLSRNHRTESLSCLQADFKGGKVAIVDADQAEVVQFQRD